MALCFSELKLKLTQRIFRAEALKLIRLGYPPEQQQIIGFEDILQQLFVPAIASYIDIGAGNTTHIWRWIFVAKAGEVPAVAIIVELRALTQ